MREIMRFKELVKKKKKTNRENTKPKIKRENTKRKTKNKWSYINDDKKKYTVIEKSNKS